MYRIARALVSVSDKTGLADFAAGLSALGIEIVSTGGTASFLTGLGLPVINVADVTGFPEMLDGRVKTLHPNVHGGILAVRDNPAHMATLAAHHITPIDLVVINLYPFAATIKRPGVSFAEAIENIDIGGPAMVRSSAKNHAFVGIVTDPQDYPHILRSLQMGTQTLSPELRKQLAAKAFHHTAAYDAQIAEYLSR